jgi:chromosome segregation ATPase
MAPTKPGSGKSSSSNAAESGPHPTNQRSAPPDTSSVPESRRKASDDWIVFEKAMKRFLENGKIYSQTDEIAQENDFLKKTADSNQRKIKELESHRKLQLDGFAEKYSEWQETEKQLIRDVENAEEDSRKTYSEEIEVLKANLETIRNEKSSLQSQLAKKKQDYNDAMKELDVWRTKTQRYEQDLAQLDDTPLETQ